MFGAVANSDARYDSSIPFVFDADGQHGFSLYAVIRVAERCAAVEGHRSTA